MTSGATSTMIFVVTHARCCFAGLRFHFIRVTQDPDAGDKLFNSVNVLPTLITLFRFKHDELMFNASKFKLRCVLMAAHSNVYWELDVDRGAAPRWERHQISENARSS